MKNKKENKKNVNKKKIIIIVSIILAVLLAIGGSLALWFTRYMRDKNDTEELFREKIAKIDYANTIETAVPQTALYDVVQEHFSSELPEGKTVKKAIIIGYDGCRADILTEIQDGNSGIDMLMDDGVELYLSYCGGVPYPEKNTQDTSTAPGWCSILTGKWADETGITGNSITKEIEPKTLLVSLLEDGLADSASFITRWKGHFENDDSTYIGEKEYCEKNDLDVTYNRCDDDEASFDATIAEIKEADCSDFIFVIYEPTDATGHDLGFSSNSPYYKEAFAEADSYGYETIKAIRERETYEEEDWLIIITSDHGGIKGGHGGDSIQERMTFYVIGQ